jgi:hypothetical protein
MFVIQMFYLVPLLLLCSMLICYTIFISNGTISAVRKVIYQTDILSTDMYIETFLDAKRKYRRIVNKRHSAASVRNKYI